MMEPNASIENKMLEKKPVVVVLGGGYTGGRVAKGLAKSGAVQVVLVDQRTDHYHKIAGLRASVNRSWADLTMIPRDQLMNYKNGQQVVGRAREIICEEEERKVVLEDGTVLDFDLLVCATGSRNMSPGEPPAHLRTRGEVRGYLQGVSDTVERSEDIVIIGGGIVGVELCGEIKEVYPEKRVRIVHSGPTLLHNSKLNPSSRFLTALLKKLERKGVEVIFNAKADLDSVMSSEQTFASGDISFNLSTGESVSCDLIFRCVGNKPNNEAYPKEWLNESGLVKVDRYLRSTVNQRVFAVGDINDAQEEKMFVYSQMQVWVVVWNILRVSRGSSPIYPYISVFPVFSLMVVPIGESDGITYTSAGSLGKSISRSIKSRTLLTERMFNDFGQPTPSFPSQSKV